LSRRWRGAIVKHDGDDRITQIKAITERHSVAHAWVRLFSDWDGQVRNGGVSQYVRNGLHTTFQNGCTGKVSDECDVHQEFVRLTEEFLNSHTIPLGETFLSIIKDFSVTLDDEPETTDCCNTCGGSGTEIDFSDDEDEGEDDTYSGCDGTGEETVSNDKYENPDVDTEMLFAKMDNRYYAINEEFIVQVASALL
jgi:hypothetical protein